MDLRALGYIVGGLVAATKASQSPQLYTAVRTGIYLTHDQIYIDLGDYYPGYLWELPCVMASKLCGMRTGIALRPL